MDQANTNSPSQTQNNQIAPASFRSEVYTSNNMGKDWQHGFLSFGNGAITFLDSTNPSIQKAFQMNHIKSIALQKGEIAITTNDEQFSEYLFYNPYDYLASKVTPFNKTQPVETLTSSVTEQWQHILEGVVPITDKIINPKPPVASSSVKIKGLAYVVGGLVVVILFTTALIKHYVGLRIGFLFFIFLFGFSIAKLRRKAKKISGQ